ncbi:MAG TPA: hypothetical protein VLF39_02265 [Candidatus Saccharimonadales bacterium]|nr:hypothetical protein [Candidatus Saccharimonadales bacterium]
MTDAKKDTIYIDVDDEITGIIDKVRRSPRKIIALVLPKRTSVLQSVVNMKLLRRAADEGEKNIVLITSETALMPLAGAAKLHVAKTLSSKPVIPPSPKTELQAAGVEEVEVDASKSVGELDDASSDETIDVDYDNADETSEDKPTKTKANKKLKVPNFERFRVLVIFGSVGLVLLIGFMVWAVNIAPKAKITIKTNTDDFNSTLNFTASPSAKTLDTTKMIIPATLTEDKKSDNQKEPATGQKDNGKKASGTMTIYYCPSNNDAQVVLPAGTAFSSDGFTFTLDQATTVPASNFTGGGDCKKDLSQTANVTANRGGDRYNLSSRSYVSSSSSITGKGSNMTGGTSQIVKVVNQSDIDGAKDQIINRLKSVAADELKKQLNDQNMFMLADSVTPTVTLVSANPSAGMEASETTVTVNVTYTVTAVAEASLKQLIETDIKHKIDPSTQTIQNDDDGLGNAVVKLGDKSASGDIKVNLQVTVTAGPQLDALAIKKEVVGKKKGDTADIIEKRPGIKDVKVQYSPFWVDSTPKKTSKITVIFEKANGQ